MYADLHLHSMCSDGTDTPLELIKLAKKNDVQVISITDHDSIAAYKMLSNEQIPKDIELITGAEISVESNHNMIHILGYYIDIFDKRFENLLAKMAVEKTENTRLNFENAVSKNIFSYDWKRVLELNADQPRISGVHVVKAMRIDGYNPGMDLWDMFHKYFFPTNIDYISISTIGAYEAIDVIKTVGGISVIAHPVWVYDNVVLDLISYGAQGLEVYHPDHSEEQISKYLRIAKEKNLYISGGTDWHGKNNGANVTHFAMCGLADENYEILKVGSRFKSK